MEIRSLQTGDVLYQRNAGKMFVPASTMKIVTAAAHSRRSAMTVSRTPVVVTGTISNGVLRGDWWWSAAATHTSRPTSPRRRAAVFRAWAIRSARAASRITGRIIGNDDVFDDVPLGRGWGLDDLADYYSAEVGGLQYKPGRRGITAAAGNAPAPRRASPSTRRRGTCA